MSQDVAALEAAKALLASAGYSLSAPKAAHVALTPDEAALLAKMAQDGRLKAFAKSDEGKAVKAAQAAGTLSWKEKIRAACVAAWTKALKTNAFAALTPYTVVTAYRMALTQPEGLRFVGCEYVSKKGDTVTGAVLVNEKGAVVSRKTSGGAFGMAVHPVSNVGKVDLPARFKDASAT